jgi:hypothetical protein
MTRTSLTKPAFAVLLALLAGPAMAQQHQQHQHGQTPYAGLQQRAIKALSEGQIADLKTGRGMGLALAAELNGYPGPLHVIEHARELELDARQRSAMQRLFEEMKAEAIPLGETLVAQEAELDNLFNSRTITPEQLANTTAAIGATQGALRNTHLKYHLSTAALLSEEQIRRYAGLRGYSGDKAGGHHRPRH